MSVLDWNDPNQVDSARLIEAEVGAPGRKMMIFSGIARPEWRINDDGHTYRESVTINLRKSVLSVDQATVSIGLASVGNGDSTFLLATDSGTIDIDPVSQELIINVDLAAQGNDTRISRFGFQAVVMVSTQATGISGSIRWARSLFDASKLPAAELAQLFQISANTAEHVNDGGFGYIKYTPVAFGITTVLTEDKNDFILGYEIPGAPYNQELYVLVQVGSLFAARNGGAGQISGPDPAVITIALPCITGVDFRVWPPMVVK